MAYYASFQPKKRSLVSRALSTIGDFLKLGFAIVAIGFVALPFIFGGSVLYIIWHFVNKVW
jgi:hypothetical protein